MKERLEVLTLLYLDNNDKRVLHLLVEENLVPTIIVVLFEFMAFYACVGSKLIAEDAHSF